jgi:hypothetical protein
MRWIKEHQWLFWVLIVFGLMLYIAFEGRI